MTAVRVEQTSPEDHTNGMVPWPYFHSGCSQQQLPVDIDLYPYGMPCPEGGSVAVESIPLSANTWHCIVFFRQGATGYQAGRMTLGPDAQIMDTRIQERSKSIKDVLAVCLLSNEVHEAPISLSRIASCITWQAAFSDDYFPVRGVAVMPHKARSPIELDGRWSQAVYSEFTASYGALFENPVEVQIQIKHRPCGVLQLCVIVNSPVEES